jgi:hypothetical protein
LENLAGDLANPDWLGFFYPRGRILGLQLGKMSPCICGLVGEGLGMITVQKMANAIDNTGVVVHMMLTNNQPKLIPQDPEMLIAEISQRATHMSSILEGILQEPHGQPRWGLNE